MADKILCPWCGAEMAMKTVHHDAPGIIHARGAKKREQRWNAWTSCTNDDCGADGPIVAELESEQEAIDAAIAAALRRYTPQLKPMTLEEVKEVKAVWIEDPEQEYESKLYPAIYWGVWNGSYSVFVADINDGEERALYRNEEYGTWWRCWERKPTDEERSAAEWET